MTERPLLLLDVDGPLAPHRAPGLLTGYQRHHITEGDRAWDVQLNREHGVLLQGMTDVFDLVWATGWEHGANRLLAPRIGLPELPTITWPWAEIELGRGPLCWKTPYVADWVGARSFAWIDDELSERDREYFAAVDRIGPHLLHTVDPAIGLTAADCDTVRAWAARL
jgi:hypothetical protein